MDKNYAEKLPLKYRQNIKGLYGVKGEKWLAALPQTLEIIGNKWNLKIGHFFPNLTFNFVAKCFGNDGEKYVLKVGVPDADAPLLTEKRTLEAFDGKGAVKVIKFDEKLCAMLLERANSGKTLSEVCGENYLKAVDVAIDVLKKLPRNPPNKTDFINLNKWIEGLNRAVKVNFETERVAKAQKFFAELVEPFERKILLHGDVHFDNILAAKREPFLLIDPKGLIGEIGYEIAVFLNDLADWTEHLPNRRQILEKSLEKFSQNFDVSEQNLRKWSYAFAVLSAWWMMEDFGKFREKDILRAEVWDV